MAGEIALDYCMREAGGFEGIGLTLRILARLENFSADAGANLSRRTMLGVLKYPVAFGHIANPALAPWPLEAEERILERSSCLTGLMPL